jgi:hypothetical protein
MDHSTRVPKPDQPRPKPDGKPKTPPRPAPKVACVLLIGDTGGLIDIDLADDTPF